MDKNEIKYPGVSLAYGLALCSSEDLEKRNEAQDDGIDKLRTFITTITLAAFGFIFSKASVGSFNSWWFWFSIAMFFYSVVLTVIAKSSGGMIGISPEILYNKFLHYNDWEFRKNILYWMAQHFEKNRNYIARKSRYFVIIFALFLIQMMCLLIWMEKCLH